MKLKKMVYFYALATSSQIEGFPCKGATEVVKPISAKILVVSL